MRAARRRRFRVAGVTSETNREISMKNFKHLDLVGFLMFAVMAVMTPVVGAWVDASHSTEYLSLAAVVTRGIIWPVWLSVVFAVAALMGWGTYSVRTGVNAGIGIWALVLLVMIGLAGSSAAVFVL